MVLKFKRKLVLCTHVLFNDILATPLALCRRLINDSAHRSRGIVTSMTRHVKSDASNACVVSLLYDLRFFLDFKRKVSS